MVWKTPIFGCMERMDICCCSCFVGPLFAGTFFLENISNIFCIFTLNKNFNKNFSEKCRIHRWKSGALVYGKFHPMWSRYSSEYDQKEAWYWRISCYGYCLLHVSRHITLSPLCHHSVTIVTLHRHAAVWYHRDAKITLTYQQSFSTTFLTVFEKFHFDTEMSMISIIIS